MKLCIPVEALSQHLVVLGKTGAGKSSSLRHIVEYLLTHKKRVCVLDIKGDWWGIKSSADGKSAGFPVIAFGNFREPKATDIPITAQTGKDVAELIASGNRPCIIGFRGWMPHEIIEFWIGTERSNWRGFASTLFSKNEGELYVVISECHNFAPKGRVDDPKSGRMLHWTNRLLSEGRGLGMTFLLDSQRPQKVHNDTLTSCETLVAMRVTYPADREAIEAWIKGCGDVMQGREVVNSLAQMARGEAWVWSPEIGFGPKRIQFPMFTTFDSFAPAQLQKKVSESGWSTVDLDAVKQKLATVIEESKANDPIELRKENTKLKAQLAAKQPDKEITIERVDPAELRRLAIAEVGYLIENHVKPYLKGYIGAEIEYASRTRERLESLMRWTMEMSPLSAKTLQFPEELPKALKLEPAMPSGASKPTLAHSKPLKRAASSRNNGFNASGDLPRGEKAVLIALAQYPDGAEANQICVLTGYKARSRDAYLQRLRERGFIERRGDLHLATQQGIAALGDAYEPLPTGEALQQYWRDRLPEGERKILELLLPYPLGAVSKESLERETGYARRSVDAYVQRLSARKLVESIGRGEVRASESLF